MFETDEDFALTHLKSADIDGKSGLAADQPSPADNPAKPRKERAVALMASGMSARSAAREVGVDVGTALIWASKAGIEVVRRPKALNEAVRDRLVTSSLIGRLGCPRHKLQRRLSSQSYANKPTLV